MCEIENEEEEERRNDEEEMKKWKIEKYLYCLTISQKMWKLCEEKWEKWREMWKYIESKSARKTRRNKYRETKWRKLAMWLWRIQMSDCTMYLTEKWLPLQKLISMLWLNTMAWEKARKCNESLED
jgi:hypothetical protein